MPIKGKINREKAALPSAAADKSTDTTIHHVALNNAVAPAEKPLFQHHLLKREHVNAQYTEQFTPDWLTFALMGIVILFTWYKLIYQRMFIQLVNAFFSMATTNQIVRDESVLLQKASLNSSVISYLVGGLFLYQVSIAHNWQNPFLLDGFIRFIMFALVIALLFSIKMIMLRLLGNIFRSERPAAAYLFTIFLFNMMAGLLLLPIVILIAYAPVEYRFLLIRLGLILLVLILLYRLGRVLIIWTSQLRAPVFYLFLYLCAFEIAPLLLLGKIALIQE